MTNQKDTTIVATVFDRVTLFDVFCIIDVFFISKTRKNDDKFMVFLISVFTFDDLL